MVDAIVKQVHWSRHIECILSLIGYAVGLGNFWRFPYMCMRNGGGAFLVPYLFFVFTASIPLFFLELSLGQFTSSSPISVWSIVPFFRGIGVSMCVFSYMASIVYSTLITWSIYYFYNCLTTGQLPWTTCDNWWNTENCRRRLYASDMASSMGNLTLSNSTSSVAVEAIRMLDDYDGDNKTMTPGEEFYQYNTLGISSGIGTIGGLHWPIVICHLVTWSTIALCLIKGIKSLGKVVYVTALLPYAFLIILAIRGLLLEGSLTGIQYYLKPDWGRVANLQIWIEAAVQAFASLGTVFGGMIVMASHNKFNNNIVRDTLMVSLVNSGTSVFAGFVVFSIVGFMAHEAGLAVDEVIQSGVGLAFVVYPEALSLLPAPQFWSGCFFFMLITLGLGTLFGIVETVIGGICERFNVVERRWVVLVLVNLSSFLTGLIFCTQGGVYFFQTLDWYLPVLILMVVATLEPLVISWIYGVDNMCKDIKMMTGREPWKIVRFLWAIYLPILMTSMLIYSLVMFKGPKYGDYVYPAWASAFGWALAAIPVLPIGYYAVKEMLLSRGTLKQRFYQLFKPTPNWGPRDPAHRLEYHARFQQNVDDKNLAADDSAAVQML